MGSSISKAKRRHRRSTSSAGARGSKKKGTAGTRPRANSDTSIAQNPREWSSNANHNHEYLHQNRHPRQYQQQQIPDNNGVPYSPIHINDNQDPYQHPDSGKIEMDHGKSARNSENNIPPHSNVSQPRTSNSHNGRPSFTMPRGRKSEQYQRENEVPQQIVRMDSPIEPTVPSGDDKSVSTEPLSPVRLHGSRQNSETREDYQRNIHVEPPRTTLSAYKARVPSPIIIPRSGQSSLMLSLPPPPQTATPPLPPLDIPSFPAPPGSAPPSVQEPQRLWRESLRNAAAEGRKNEVALTRSSSGNSYTSQSSAYSSSGRGQRKSKTISGSTFATSTLSPSPSNASQMSVGVHRKRSFKSNAIHPEGSLPSIQRSQLHPQQPECSENASIISLPGSRYKGRDGVLRTGDDESVMTGRNASELSLLGSVPSAAATGGNTPSQAGHIGQNDTFSNQIPGTPQQHNEWSPIEPPLGAGDQRPFAFAPGERVHNHKPSISSMRESMSTVSTANYQWMDDRIGSPGVQGALQRDSFMGFPHPPGTFEHGSPIKSSSMGRFSEQQQQEQQNQQLLEHQARQHALLKCFLKGNYHAPLNKQTLGSILDVGCGTGLWMKDMALEFPMTEIHGIDKNVPTRRRRHRATGSAPNSPSPTSPQSFGGRKMDHHASLQSNFSFGTSDLPISTETAGDYPNQTTEGSMPSNCFFHKADVAMGIPFPDNTFDYCHVRLVLWGYPLNCFPDLLNELIRVTKVGGWIEFVDMDPCILKATETGTYINEWIKTGLIHSNMDPDLVKTLPKFLREFHEATTSAVRSNSFSPNPSKSRTSLILPTQPFGLDKLSISKVSLPFGPWGGHIGELWQQTFTTFLKGLEPMMVGATQAGVVMDQYHRQCQQEMQQVTERSLDASDQKLCTQKAWRHLIQQLVKDASLSAEPTSPTSVAQSMLSSPSSIKEMRSYNNFYIAYAQKTNLVELKQQQILQQLEQQVLSPNPNVGSPSMFPMPAGTTFTVQPRKQSLSYSLKHNQKQQLIGNLHENPEQNKRLASTLRERISPGNLNQRYASGGGSSESKWEVEEGSFSPRNKNRYGLVASLTQDALESFNRAHNYDQGTRGGSSTSSSVAPPTPASVAALSIRTNSRNSNKTSIYGSSGLPGTPSVSSSIPSTPGHHSPRVGFGGSKFQGQGHSGQSTPVVQPTSTSTSEKGHLGTTSFVPDYFNQVHFQHSPVHPQQHGTKKSSLLSQVVVPDVGAADDETSEPSNEARESGDGHTAIGLTRHLGGQGTNVGTKTTEGDDARRSNILIALNGKDDGTKGVYDAVSSPRSPEGFVGMVPERRVTMSVVQPIGGLVPMESSSAVVEHTDDGDEDENVIEIVNGVLQDKNDWDDSADVDESQLQMLQVDDEEILIMMAHDGFQENMVQSR